MRDFTLILLVVGFLIVAGASFLISFAMEFRRRRDQRLASAHDTAMRFRRRYGDRAEGAVVGILGRRGLSARKRRFYRAVAGELKRLDSASEPQRVPAPTPTRHDHGEAAPILRFARRREA